jgi:hypothetical protein
MLRDLWRVNMRRRDCLGELVQIDGSEHAWFDTRGENACGCSIGRVCATPDRPGHPQKTPGGDDKSDADPAPSTSPRHQP